MEEGQTVEIQETREPLREQGSIRALLELLEQQGMEQEKGDVLRMADYIDSMEIQLGTVLKELGEVKKQLGVMQESKVKLFAVNTIQRAEHQVQTLRSQVGEFKTKFVGRAEQAVMDFKEKGKDALACAVKGMHLTQGLQKIQSSLHTVMLSMDQKIDRLGSMAEELHVAKGHLNNAFLGNEWKRIQQRSQSANPEQGIIFQTQKVLFQSMRSIHKLEQKTERWKQQAEKLEAREGKQLSVRNTLQELRQEQHPLKLGKEEKRKVGGSIKRSFSERGESHERRNNHYLSCSRVRGVPWDGGMYRMYIFKRSLPALPEILQTFPSDAPIFGIFPAPCRRSFV